MRTILFPASFHGSSFPPAEKSREYKRRIVSSVHNPSEPEKERTKERVPILVSRKKISICILSPNAYQATNILFYRVNIAKTSVLGRS